MSLSDLASLGRGFDDASARTDGLEWDALLAEFHALGGEAENVVLRRGPRGRGVFAFDPSKPVKLRVPPNLLVRGEDTEIRDGQLVIKPAASVGERERIFFERYQRVLVWGGGVFDDLWQQQLAWSRFPETVRKALKECWPIGDARFLEPNAELCRERYLRTRVILFGEVYVVPPLVELVNHGSQAAGFDCTNGVAVLGTFDEEVLVNYGFNDSWGMAVGYGFFEARRHAHSVRCVLKFENCRIEISRLFNRVERHNGFALPAMRIDGDSIHLPFLTLGSKGTPRAPRAIWLHLMKNAPIKQPNELFDLIQHHNRLCLLNFLSSSEGCAMPPVALLRSAAYQQLETLSNHWGTRSLDAGDATPSN